MYDFTFKVQSRPMINVNQVDDVIQQKIPINKGVRKFA
jgi:hypothetical protein